MRTRLNNRVACDCNGLRGTGFFEVEGEWLVLHSTLGVHRTRLGISNPKKLAARLLKNVCSKAAAATSPPNAVEFVRGHLGVAEKAQELVDAQRNKITGMSADDPTRSAEERILDQAIINARIIDTTARTLAPEPVNADRVARK